MKRAVTSSQGLRHSFFHFPMTHTSFFWHFVVCVWYGLGMGVGLEEELCFEPKKVPYTKATEKLQEMQKRNKGWWSKNLVSLN